MQKLADHLEEAFDYFDNGDIRDFIQGLIDAADFGIQSGKSRNFANSAIQQYLSERSALLPLIKKVIQDNRHLIVEEVDADE